MDIDEHSFLRGVVGIAMCLLAFFDVSRICQRWVGLQWFAMKGVMSSW